MISTHGQSFFSIFSLLKAEHDETAAFSWECLSLAWGGCSRRKAWANNSHWRRHPYCQEHRSRSSYPAFSSVARKCSGWNMLSFETVAAPNKPHRADCPGQGSQRFRLSVHIQSFGKGTCSQLLRKWSRMWHRVYSLQWSYRKTTWTHTHTELWGASDEQIVGISIESELGSCVLQRRGRLILENCMLHCLPHSLDHLSVWFRSIFRQWNFSFSSKRLSKLPGLLQVAIAVAGGQVSVEGTVIMGGPKAVSVMNPLRKLGNTRVLYHQSKLVFWFCVQ